MRISIHALLAESDRAVYNKSMLLHLFLSTLSLRRATDAVGNYDRWSMNFYPRSPCGERLGRYSDAHAQGNFYPRSPCGERLHYDGDADRDVKISIHALLAESDLGSVAVGLHMSKFLSTLSLRRATTELLAACTAIASISIHALLAESDQT